MKTEVGAVELSAATLWLEAISKSDSERICCSKIDTQNLMKTEVEAVEVSAATLGIRYNLEK